MNALEDPLTNFPVTGTEHEGIKCMTYRSDTSNTFTRRVAGCIKNRECWAVEKRGNRGIICGDRKTKTWKTTLNGMINLAPEKGRIVWFKGN